jgi:hypothetical protein
MEFLSNQFWCIGIRFVGLDKKLQGYSSGTSSRNISLNVWVGNPICEPHQGHLKLLNINYCNLTLPELWMYTSWFNPLQILLLGLHYEQQTSTFKFFCLDQSNWNRSFDDFNLLWKSVVSSRYSRRNCFPTSLCMPNSSLLTPSWLASIALVAKSWIITYMMCFVILWFLFT